MQKYVNTNDCIPMKELDREYYDQSNYSYLKKVIESDGFSPAHPLRGIFNKEIEKYEIFVGIHRLAIAKEIGITKVPLSDETDVLTRPRAIALGIKENKSHAYYNFLALAIHLKTLSDSFTKDRPSDSLGRPETIKLKMLAEQTRMDEKTISKYLQLLRLPEDVQKMIGQGKLKLSHAIILLGLEGTDYADKIGHLAQEVCSNGLSRKELERRVVAIKKKGYYEAEAKICVGCKKTFPNEAVSNPCLCPECLKNLKLGGFAEPDNEKTRKAMKFYLCLNDMVNNNYTKKGIQIPENIQKFLERKHEEWQPISELNGSDTPFTDSIKEQKTRDDN